MRHGNAVRFKQLADAQVGQDPGVGARSQQLSPFDQVLEIKRGGLGVMADGG